VLLREAAHPPTPFSQATDRCGDETVIDITGLTFGAHAKCAMITKCLSVNFRVRRHVGDNIKTWMREI